MQQTGKRRTRSALKWRRTKIIATLGPASNTPTMIEQLISSGVNLVRINMSHGDQNTHRTTIQRVRRAAAKAGCHIGILMDLCGPKIRVGCFEGNRILLKAGARVTVTTRKVIGTDRLIPSQYTSLHKDVLPGELILLDDGKLSLKVIGVEGRDVRCKVIDGGWLSDQKGMNLPDSDLSTRALTAKDRADAAFGIEMEVDFVALSFVRAAKDVAQLKRYMHKRGAAIPIVSKIERPEAVADIDTIIAASDGIMIARGDLGIELPAERVPLIQRDIVSKSRQAGVPVIVATQMLESMMSCPRPTRAEVTDVAGAALLSADAVMLSGETAAGQYPLETVKIMDKVLREVEQHQWQENSFADEPIANRGSKLHFTRESMAHAAVQLARDLGLDAIIVPTNTGTTARILAAHRPLATAVGVCADERICRRMALHWGVVPVKISRAKTGNWRDVCHQIADICQLGHTGSDMLLVSGFNDDPALNEPVLKLLHL
ncbi:Pyruvate kinase [hydrothermal vent metagenome]|uniref:pyruvate kinase n=1 Tax=hydrothermal vent metagenome TaxID=652676 RepID=A0A3B0YKR2_9ZZZZ